jgi:hypothetical protein
MITFENDELIIIDNLNEKLFLLITNKQIYLKVNYGSMHSDTINFEELAKNGVSDATINELKELYKEAEEND